MARGGIWKVGAEERKAHLEFHGVGQRPQFDEDRPRTYGVVLFVLWG